LRTTGRSKSRGPPHTRLCQPANLSLNLTHLIIIIIIFCGFFLCCLLFLLRLNVGGGESGSREEGVILSQRHNPFSDCFFFVFSHVVWFVFVFSFKCYTLRWMIVSMATVFNHVHLYLRLDTLLHLLHFLRYSFVCFFCCVFFFPSFFFVLFCFTVLVCYLLRSSVVLDTSDGASAAAQRFAGAGR